MSHTTFDDPEVCMAMSAFLQTARMLDEANRVGADARALLDLAEARSVAGLALRQRLVAAGWTAPVGQRSTR